MDFSYSHTGEEHGWGGSPLPGAGHAGAGPCLGSDEEQQQAQVSSLAGPDHDLADLDDDSEVNVSSPAWAMGSQWGAGAQRPCAPTARAIGLQCCALLLVVDHFCFLPFTQLMV